MRWFPTTSGFLGVDQSGRTMAEVIFDGDCGVVSLYGIGEPRNASSVVEAMNAGESAQRATVYPPRFAAPKSRTLLIAA